MEAYIIRAGVMVASFGTMELIAWFTHKFLMHGLLWRLHKDHHKKESAGFFEHNDFFFLIFALPGIAGLFWGVKNGFDWVFWVGLGITLYGLAYFLVHDVFIHQRFKILRNTDNPYFKGLRRAHKVHHKHLQKNEGECFGMLWVPLKYFRAKAKVGNA